MKDVFILPRKASRTVALMLAPDGFEYSGEYVRAYSEDERVAQGKRRYLDLRSQIIKELRQGYPPVILAVG
jgi:hypothetical protein